MKSPDVGAVSLTVIILIIMLIGLQYSINTIFAINVSTHIKGTFYHAKASVM